MSDKAIAAEELTTRILEILEQKPISLQVGVSRKQISLSKRKRIRSY